MDMKYRDRNEIIAQILESANGNRVRLTKIMYDVYLSHVLTKEYVRLLIEKGLMEYLDGERTFKATDKGMNFLRIHHKVQGLTLLSTKSQRREILEDTQEEEDDDIKSKSKTTQAIKLFSCLTDCGTH
jgi:predicted transcriptional regulator